MGTALVVEDSLTEREIIMSYLKEAGMTIATVGSGEEALERVKTDLPDIIILDVVLPGRSGFEICRDLKAEATTSKVPVIMCSTKGSEMDKFWGMKQGADAYLPKPVDKEEFIKTVKKLTNQ